MKKKKTFLLNFNILVNPKMVNLAEVDALLAEISEVVALEKARAEEENNEYNILVKRYKNLVSK